MYQIFDIALDSDMPLPELSQIESSQTVIKVNVGKDKTETFNDPDWFYHWETSDGVVFGSCAKCKEGYLLSFPDIADFIISYDFDQILYFKETSTPEETLRHLLLDHIIPRILGQQGSLLLHASAVILPNGKSIAFLGNSGWGKSTIASSFHENGAQLITDDCLLIQKKDAKIIGIPNYYGLRLFNDSAEAIFSLEKDFSTMAHYSEKKRLIMYKQESEKKDSEIIIDALFFLNDPEAAEDKALVEIKPSSGVREFMGIVEKMFILDTTDKLINKQQFQNIRDIISSNANIYKLQYPRNDLSLKAVQESINRLLLI